MENSVSTEHSFETTVKIDLSLIKATQSVAETKSMSNYNQHLLYLYNSKWFVCEAIHFSCIAVALYLLCALLRHKIMQNRRHKNLGNKRKGGALLENLCIVGILLALGRFTNNQMLLFYGWSPNSLCSPLLNVSIAMYFISINPVYLFLWVRQRIFYSSPALRHLFSKYVQILSWATLVSFIMTSIVSMIFFVIDAQNSASGRVCQLSSKLLELNLSEQEIFLEASHHGVKVNIVTGLVASAIQICFLALFLYPIMDSKLQALRIDHMQNGCRALISLVRRSFLLAGCCIVSDVAIVFIIKAIHINVPDAIFAPLATYDANLILNYLCIIMTFRRWKIILFPWYFTRCGSKPLFFSRRQLSTYGRNSTGMRQSPSYDQFSSIILKRSHVNPQQSQCKLQTITKPSSPLKSEFQFTEVLPQNRNGFTSTSRENVENI